MRSVPSLGQRSCMRIHTDTHTHTQLHRRARRPFDIVVCVVLHSKLGVFSLCSFGLFGSALYTTNCWLGMSCTTIQARVTFCVYNVYTTHGKPFDDSHSTIRTLSIRWGFQLEKCREFVWVRIAIWLARVDYCVCGKNPTVLHSWTILDKDIQWTSEFSLDFFSLARTSKLG